MERNRIALIQAEMHRLQLRRVHPSRGAPRRGGEKQGVNYRRTNREEAMHISVEEHRKVDWE